MADRDPQHPSEPYPEDEIDLADLAGVLYRRRWLIIGGTVLVFLLALLVTFLIPAKYEFRTILEMGQFQREGEYKLVESPKASAERLKVAARKVAQNWESQGKEPGFSVKNNFTAEPSEEGGIVELALEASGNAQGAAFLNEVTGDLMADHSRILDVERQKFQQEIQSLQGSLEQLQGKTASYKRRLELLEKERAFLKEQVDQATARMDDLLASKSQASLNGGQEPVALMLFSSEIQRVRSYIDELRTRLMADIPQMQEQLRVLREDTRAKITRTRAELKSQKIALNNMIQTRPIMAPNRSENPVSPNLKLNLALGLVLGAFLSVFLAFLVEFWANNRKRIVQS
jgi:LPS O-antigen subunit length determinant protein (WzzB/FepE family)